MQQHHKIVIDFPEQWCLTNFFIIYQSTWSISCLNNALDSQELMLVFVRFIASCTRVHVAIQHFTRCQIGKSQNMGFKDLSVC